MTISEYLSASGRTQSDLARAIGCDKGNFHRILNGVLKPTAEQALAIERETGGAVSASDLSHVVRLARETAPASAEAA